MLCEFTGTDNYPVLVNFFEIAAVVQKKKYTYIYLNSGVCIKVLDSVAEISSDIQSARTEQQLIEATLGQLENA